MHAAPRRALPPVGSARSPGKCGALEDSLDRTDTAPVTSKSVASGYGSRCLAKASACAAALRCADGSSFAQRVRACAWIPYLIVLLCVIPRTRVRLSRGASGERIRAHLELKRWGLPRFRLAQGVLDLPVEYRTYLRGRRRQAVRTNVARAREQGISCGYSVVRDWAPSDHVDAPAAPVELWLARDMHGDTVGEAWVTVDDQCALMHSLVTTRSGVRWLLHTSIVEHLCERGCTQLLTNSHDAFLMPAGQQYFQHLLGYEVGRVRLSKRPSRRAPRPGNRVGAILGLVSAAALGEWALASFL
jgi:hypothetical protein